jgi:O-methyltransferase involved in polyketide biosynthesis
MELSQISRTAILLLICRAIEAEKDQSLFSDPMAAFCLERLISMVSGDDKGWIIKKKRSFEGIQVEKISDVTGMRNA